MFNNLRVSILSENAVGDLIWRQLLLTNMETKVLTDCVLYIVNFFVPYLIHHIAKLRFYKIKTFCFHYLMYQRQKGVLARKIVLVFQECRKNTMSQIRIMECDVNN